ncbi:hypothetical protein Gpo141_00011374 [Globisporangium polare]
MASSRGEAERADDAAGKPDAARIPRLFPSSSAFPVHSQQQQRQQGFFQQPHSAFPHQSAADVMLGLKTLATHADRQVPILNHDGNPMPTFPSLRVSPSLSSSFTQRMASTTTNTASRPFPPVIATSREDLRDNSRLMSTGQAKDDSENKVSPVRFGEYLGRKHKRGESRVPDNESSPTSRSQVYGSDREITLSPPSTAVPGPRILPVATTIAWRSSSSIFSPNSKKLRTSSPGSLESKAPFTLAPLEPQRSTLPIASLTRSTSGPAAPGVGQPLLVRKVSSKWRDELEEQDRRKSRERIQRGLNKHSEGDYDVLLLIIAAMEEELLHIKTTSKEHFFQQAQALSSEIQHAALER